MDKEKILQRARAEGEGKPDEREREIRFKGEHLGFLLGALFAVGYYFLERYYFRQPGTQVLAVACFMMAASSLYTGIRLKKVRDIANGILFVVLTAALLVIYFLERFREVLEWF